MSEDELDKLIRDWYHRKFQEDQYQIAADCPPLTALWRHVAEDASLAEYTEHVSQCPRCQRLLELIRRERRHHQDDPDADVGNLSQSPTTKGRNGHRRALDHPATGSQPGRSARFKLLGLAAAACLVVSLVLLWNHSENGQALGNVIQEMGYLRPLPSGLAGKLISDPEQVQATLDEIAQDRAKLAHSLVGQRSDDDAGIVWAQIYRQLLSLGQWDEALAEMQKCLAYCEERYNSPQKYDFYYVCLRDFGLLYASWGDYDTALTYHQRSLTVAREHQAWLTEQKRKAGQDNPAHQGGVTSTLVPRLWDLSTLCAARGEPGDTQKAWEYHHQAGQLLTTFFRQECKRRGLAVKPDASLPELCQAVAADGDKGLESLTTKVREHLFHQARLLRLDRKVDEAKAILEVSAKLPYHEYADESRLNFNEPMEQLRLAIAKGDYRAALTWAEQAQQNAGPRRFRSIPPHAAMGPIAHAELTFFRGVASLGLNKNDPEARQLLESALSTVKSLSKSLPPTVRDRFLKSFEDWQGAVAFLHCMQAQINIGEMGFLACDRNRFGVNNKGAYPGIVERTKINYVDNHETYVDSPRTFVAFKSDVSEFARLVGGSKRSFAEIKYDSFPWEYGQPSATWSEDPNGFFKIKERCNGLVQGWSFAGRLRVVGWRCVAWHDAYRIGQAIEAAVCTRVEFDGVFITERHSS